MDPNVELVLRLLIDSTGRIGGNHFALQIAEQDIPAYRERVYGYELYHQLRCSWPPGLQYDLHGEVDKRGHPLMKRLSVKNAIPDLLVHRPGHMAGNLVVVEIKRVDTGISGIKKDLAKLGAFCQELGYQIGVLLLFGPSIEEAVRRRCQRALETVTPPLDPRAITVLWQSTPFAEARTVIAAAA